MNLFLSDSELDILITVLDADIKSFSNLNQDGFFNKSISRRTELLIRLEEALNNDSKN